MLACVHLLHEQVHIEVKHWLHVCYQESCFETKIHREETEDLQIGVKAIIVIAITIVIFVILYNIVYQVCDQHR